MKIALITPDNIHKVQGATEAYYVRKYLSARHELISVTGNRKREKIQSQGPDAHVVQPHARIPYTLWYVMVTLWILFKNRHRFDLVYTYRDSLFIGALFKLFNKKLVCDFRTEPVEQEIEFRSTALKKRRMLPLKIKEFLYRQTIPLCDHLVTLSQEIKATLASRYHAKNRPIHIQPLGVDMDRFKNPNPPGLDALGIRMINVTSMAPQRRVELDLEALAILLQRNIPATLTLVGGGDAAYMERLKAHSRRLCIDHAVDWKGYVPHHQIPDLLGRHHVGLSTFPNLKAFQVASVSKVFEYLAMDLVVVAGDVLSNTKIVRHGHNGLLFRAGDAKDMADQIQTLWESPDRFRELRKQTRKTAAPYHWETMLSQLMAAIQAG